jgi:alpha,alpha-trehalase
MSDGSLLNRYWDARDTPRDESYAEDVATSAQAAPRAAAQTNRDLRAGAESGWDYSSRWLRDGRTLATIHTTDIVPVDLNSLMWNLEISIARRCAALGDTACERDFTRKAQARKAAIATWLWSARDQRFVDRDRSTGAADQRGLRRHALSALRRAGDAGAGTGHGKADPKRPAGPRGPAHHHDPQWPAMGSTQWLGATDLVAVEGLRKNGQDELARVLAHRWIATVSAFYDRTGRMVEKYDIETGEAGGGGEYPVQDGFGWTNGVTRALTARYPNEAPGP